MSQLRAPYPQPDFGELIQHRSLSGIPKSALWWRIEIMPDEHGNVCYRTDIDGIDELALEPNATIAYTWEDGGGTEFAQAYAAHIAHERIGSPDIGVTGFTEVSKYRMWIDALSIDPPTGNPAWRSLTRSGNHRHPDWIDEINRTRSVIGLMPINRTIEGF